LPAEVSPANVPPAEVLLAEVSPAEVLPCSESSNVEIQSDGAPLADTSNAEVLDADISAEVLEAEFPSELEISSVETPSEMPVQVKAPTVTENFQVEAALYVQRLVARILGV